MIFVQWLTQTQTDWYSGATRGHHSYDHTTGQRKKIIDGHEQRQGQFYFNRLYQVRPDLADGLRGTLQDPFYRDDRIPGFLTVVGDLWEVLPSDLPHED